MSGGAAPVHATTAHIDIADLDASSLVFGGAAVDAAGTITGRPQLYRYDMALGAVEHFASAADGTGCIGCHVAVSRDGSRMVAAGMAVAGGPMVRIILDMRTRSMMTVSEASPWNTGTYDPSGLLLTSFTTTGELTLRDGSTAAPIATLALGEPAAAPAISPDGRFLAYAAMVAPEGGNPAGTALRVRPWDAASASVGDPITVVTDAGILAPDFSSDGAWILYTRSAEPNDRTILGASVVRADGSAPPIELSTGAGDRIPRWASPVAPAVPATGHPSRSRGWRSRRAVPSVPARCPARRSPCGWPRSIRRRGVFGRPFHLPGQSRSLSALHSPYSVP